MVVLDDGAAGADKAFSEGKVSAPSFVAFNFLPLLTEVRVVEFFGFQFISLEESALRLRSSPDSGRGRRDRFVG